MRRAWAIASKELLQASRDPLSLAMLLGVPAMMLLLYGYAINFDVRHVRLAVQDRDRSAASRELIAAFVHSTYFDLTVDLLPGADPEELTQRRVAKAALVIPERYGDDLEAGRGVSVQLLLDGADANTATTVLGYAQALIEGLNAERASRRLPGAARLSGVRYEPRVFYNPELKSTQFLVPGLTAFILMLTAVISTALSAPWSNCSSPRCAHTSCCSARRCPIWPSRCSRPSSSWRRPACCSASWCAARTSTCSWLR